METAFQITLIAATLLCSLVAGIVLAFAIVVMPGLRALGDGEFITAFQAVDRVIQNRQPLFGVVWAGSVLTLIAAAALGAGQLSGTNRILLLAATALYLLGAQLPTALINLPLNNRVQAHNIGAMTPSEQSALRDEFESRWNMANSLRTVVACITSTLLLSLLLKM